MITDCLSEPTDAGRSREAGEDRVEANPEPQEPEEMKEDLSSLDSAISMTLHGDNFTGVSSGVAFTDQLATTSSVVHV